MISTSARKPLHFHSNSQTKAFKRSSRRPGMDEQGLFPEAQQRNRLFGTQSAIELLWSSRMREI